jgi:glycosyltransferase involved in cell wall biosynthesis
MVNRPEKNWTGGDFIKLKKVTAELNKLGVRADILELEKLGMNEWYGVEEYDIVHTWNFSMPWSKYAVWLGGKKKKKVVASMIYHDTEVFIPYNFQQIMMDHMDACIYETESEIERVERHLVPKNSYILPNGLDSDWFKDSSEKVPLNDYVLTVGRIEPNKGQLEAALACKELGLAYVCIGEPAVAEYAKEVASAGAVIYPALSQEKLKPWYKDCSVYIQPSSTETWGMAVDEAAAQGAKVVVSTGFERKSIPGAVYCIHGNEESIAHSIRQALSQERDRTFQAQLKKRTWEKYAKELIKIYEEIV